MAHKVLEYVHSLAARCINSGDTAVDATAGNGRDTVRLASLVGEAGQVWSFDVQSVALRKTFGLAVSEGVAERVTLVQDSHENVPAYVRKGVRVAMFNLGYLPGGNHAIRTRPASTRLALERMSPLILRGGMVLVVLYRGHDGGAEEARVVLDWAEGLDAAAWSAVRFGFSQASGAPPEALAVRRLNGPS